MITSLFKKSTPINYALVLFLVLICFVLYHFDNATADFAVKDALQKVGLFGIILASLFFSNFIVKKNSLSKDSAYTIFFFFLLLLFFPKLLDNSNLLISNFFIILALRRILSLQSSAGQKEKIFDASLWVFVAALFHFWSIAFIFVVFVAILFSAAQDYRNWLLPFVAFVAVWVLFLVYSYAFSIEGIAVLLNKTTSSFKLDYFEATIDNIAFSIFAALAIYLTLTQMIAVNNKPVIVQSGFKIILLSFFVGVFVFLISPHKNNEMLLFTFLPLSIMATSEVEGAKHNLRQELSLAVFIICGLYLFTAQL